MLSKDFEIKEGVKVWEVIPYEDENCKWGTIESVNQKYIVVDGKKFDIKTHRAIKGHKWELYASPEDYQKNLEAITLLKNFDACLPTKRKSYS